MKTAVIFILVHLIACAWSVAPHFFLFSIIASPYILQNIKETDIRHHIDKLNPKCSNFSEILKQETFPNLWDCAHLNIDHNLTVCEMAYNVIENCTVSAEAVFENCITNDHKYWPSLIKKSLMSVRQYLCETRGGSLLEVINPCIWNNTEEIEEKFKKYDDQLQAKLKEYTITQPFPKELCDYASGDIRKYISTRLETTCHNQETQSDVLNLYDAIIAPCEQYNAVDSYRNETYTDDTEF